MGSSQQIMYKLAFLLSVVSALPQRQYGEARHQGPVYRDREDMGQYIEEPVVYREEPKIEKRKAIYVEPEVPQPFQYEYGVKDDYSGNAFAKTETQNDLGQVQGSYKVNLPDGRIQTVNYHADPQGGFVAEVSYEGVPQYPEPPPGGYGPYQGPGAYPGPAPYTNRR